jgi:Cu2+-exporting ATPase
VATLRDKLWVSLALTIPVVLLSDDVQVWVGYSVPPHAGDEYAAAILGTLVFLYGGLVFIARQVSDVLVPTWRFG